MAGLTHPRVPRACELVVELVRGRLGGVMEGKSGVKEGKSGSENEGVVDSVCFVVVGGATGGVVFLVVVVGESSSPGFGRVTTPGPEPHTSPSGQQPLGTQYSLQYKVSLVVNLMPKSILTLEDNRHQRLEKERRKLVRSVGNK